MGVLPGAQCLLQHTMGLALSIQEQVGSVARFPLLCSHTVYVCDVDAQIWSRTLRPCTMGSRWACTAGCSTAGASGAVGTGVGWIGGCLHLFCNVSRCVCAADAQVWSVVLQGGVVWALLDVTASSGTTADFRRFEQRSRSAHQLIALILQCSHMCLTAECRATAFRC